VSVSEPTVPGGHGGTGGAVGHGVSNTQTVAGQPTTRPDRPFRCLRHRAWMAACTDCRKAHSIRIAKRHESAPADAPR
jgi:hypothetical protein